MAFVAFAGCMQGEVRMVGALSKKMEITFWAQLLIGTIGQSDVDAFAAALDGWAAVELIPLMNAGITYVESYVRDMTAQISFQGLDNSNTGAGTRSGTAVDQHTCAVVQRKSGFVGRSANGRVYVPGAVTGDRVNNSTWASGYITALNTALALSDSAIVSAGYVPIIASRKLRAAGTPLLASVFPIVDWVASANMAAYRERSGS